MGRERPVIYGQMIRSNEGCVFVVGRKIMLSKWKCGDSIRISLRQLGLG